jgi:hypothetical protein
VHDSTSDRERHNHVSRVATAVGVAAFELLLFRLFNPEVSLAQLLGYSAGTAVLVLAVIKAVKYFRHHILGRVPTRFEESSSAPIRIVTKVAKAYAVYFVGFWTVIAVLSLFTVIGHFI